MCHRRSFREDINEKCILCKLDDNGIKHVLKWMWKIEKKRKRKSIKRF